MKRSIIPVSHIIVKEVVLVPCDQRIETICLTILSPLLLLYILYIISLSYCPLESLPVVFSTSSVSLDYRSLEVCFYGPKLFLSINAFHPLPFG